MASRLPTEPPRGMRDILPAEAELRDAAAGTILGVYRRYGFRRIETPALESLELLTGGGGGENEKLIFKVLKRGEKLDLGAAATEADLADLGLRFDLTVPLARYYAHNHGQAAGSPPGGADRPGLARRAAAAGPLPPVHPVRHRHPRRRVGDRRDRADPRHHGGARRARARRPHRADQRPPPPGRHGHAGAASRRSATRASSSPSTSGTSSRRARSAQELAQAGHPAAAIARMLELYATDRARAEPGRACERQLGNPSADGAFAALSRIIEAVGAAARRPVRASTSTRRSCGAWATTRGRSSRSARRASPRAPSRGAGGTTA